MELGYRIRDYIHWIFLASEESRPQVPLSDDEFAFRYRGDSKAFDRALRSRVGEVLKRHGVDPLTLDAIRTESEYERLARALGADFAAAYLNFQWHPDRLASIARRDLIITRLAFVELQIMDARDLLRRKPRGLSERVRSWLQWFPGDQREEEFMREIRMLTGTQWKSWQLMVPEGHLSSAEAKAFHQAQRRAEEYGRDSNALSSHECFTRLWNPTDG